MSSPSPSHAEPAIVLIRPACAAGAGASDLHGSLIGYLCAGGMPQAELGAQARDGDSLH